MTIHHPSCLSSRFEVVHRINNKDRMSPGCVTLTELGVSIGLTNETWVASDVQNSVETVMLVFNIITLANR
jgi:hypothetical protein